MGQLTGNVTEFGMDLKSRIKRLPIVGRAVRWLERTSRPLRIRLVQFNSSSYWDSRYAKGGNSGNGSYGELAKFKAGVINDFVADNQITSVIEFGCGDGNQLSLAKYPRYVGIDVSPTALRRCQEHFHRDTTKTFLPYDEPAAYAERAELTLSLDVIYHLVEDEIYEKYMGHVFEAATRFVIVYSDNEEAPRDMIHVRHRKFSNWIEQHQPAWRLIRHIPNKFPWDPETQRGSFADFWIYEKSH
ncbi:MAG: class I SAM-dependent methyltransferase [Candidatus Acidiferrales bacterium]